MAGEEGGEGPRRRQVTATEVLCTIFFSTQPCNKLCGNYFFTSHVQQGIVRP